MSPLQRFILKALALGSPLALAAGVYVIRDPFRVIRHYDFEDYFDQFAPVQVNRDFASLQIFLARYPEESYDSFILGSSRSEAFHCDVWRPYIGGDAARPFHWPANTENVLGMARKIQYLDAHKVRLAHVFIEASYVTLGAIQPRTDPTHRLPYEVSGEGWFDFQAADFTAFFSDFYFVKYTDYALSGTIRPYASSALAVHQGDFHINPRTNEMEFARWERELHEDEVGFYLRHSDEFPPPPTGKIPCREPWLAQTQLELLEEIHAVFEKQHTDYRILIAPFADQVCLNRGDLEKLQKLFGVENVYDYSGQNEITSDKHNFYDGTHIRPAAADRILRDIYEGNR